MLKNKRKQIRFIAIFLKNFYQCKKKTKDKEVTRNNI